MSDDERQIRTIIDYVEEYLPEPQATWPKVEFLRMSYSRWAANYIIKLLYNNPTHTPIRVIEDFKYQMNKYIQKSTNHPEANVPFQYAYEVACDLEDILMAMMPY